MKARHLALTALFVGPTAAMLDLTLSYYLVYPSQPLQSKWPLHVVSVVAALVTIAGVAMSRRALVRRDGGAEVDRFLALSGMVLNAFFLLVIVAFVVPKVGQGLTD